jgi:hypothetical protein
LEHAQYHWLMLAESHPTKRLFAAMDGGWVYTGGHPGSKMEISVDMKPDVRWICPQFYAK